MGNYKGELETMYERYVSACARHNEAARERNILLIERDLLLAVKDAAQGVVTEHNSDERSETVYLDYGLKLVHALDAWENRNETG